MSTINKKTQLYKYAFAAVLILIFTAVQNAGAEDYWKCVDSNRLEPNTAGDSAADINNITASETVTAGKLRTTGSTASGTKAAAFGNNTQATGNYAVAFGNGAVASGTEAAALGVSKARGEASFAVGYADDSNNIDANDRCSIAMGYVTSLGWIRSWNWGSIATGHSINDANIYSAGCGSFAGGDANNSGSMDALGDGSIVIGWNNGGNTKATSEGSIAMGYNNGGNLLSRDYGTIAMGYVASGRTIDANGNGSIAMGYASSGDIEATGDGSVAIGDGVAATANNAFALGTGFTNSTASSLAVGFGQKDLEVSSGSVKVNGDLEVTGNLKVDTVDREAIWTFPNVGSNGANLGDYRVVRVADFNSEPNYARFSFYIPSDLNSVDSLTLKAYITSAAADAAANVDFNSVYAGAGESYIQHEDGDTASTYNLSSYAGKWYGFDVTGLFPSVEPNDYCGLRIRNRTGGNIDCAELILKYEAK